MAKAEAAPRLPTLYVPVWEPYVTLTLSKEEAQTLYDVTRAIGGSALRTRKGHLSDKQGSIMEALEPYVSREDSVRDMGGTIWFV